MIATKILLTGATGFVGGSVIEALAKRQDHFQAFCIYKGVPGPFLDNRFTWIECDLSDASACASLMMKLQPTHCIHLAWDVPPQEFWHSLKNVDWIYYSVALFKAFANHGGKVFLGAGSIAEYDWSATMLGEQDTPLIPATLYGETKRSLYSILNHVKRTHFPHTALLWARIGHFFGEFQPQQKLFSRLFKSLETRESLAVMPPDIRRPYAHVKHLGEALIRATFALDQDLIFNIGASQSYSLREIVETLAEGVQKDTSPIIYGGYRPPVSEPFDFKISMERFEQAVGWSIPDTFSEDAVAFAQNLKKNCVQK